MKCWICVVVLVSIEISVNISGVYSSSVPCDCLCTGESSNAQQNRVELTVSGTYCKAAGTLSRHNLVSCSKSCDKTWRVVDPRENPPLCVCNNATTMNTLCKQCSGGPLSLNCVCNLTNGSVEIPTVVTTTPVSAILDVTTSRYDPDFSPGNFTRLPPRRHSPLRALRVGLGVVFGIAIIIAMVFVVLFLYRRYQQDIDNQRKTPEVPVYASTQDGDARWTSRGSLDNPTYTKEQIASKKATLPYDSSQDSSTHYTCLQLNDRGMSNEGYADAENYSKPLNGHSTSGELDDDHEYQGLYTEVTTPTTPTDEGKTILGRTTDDSEGDYPADCISPSSSIGDNLHPDIKLSAAGFDTDSSEPYYIRLNRDDSDDQSPCLSVPGGSGGGGVPLGIGKYNGSTSGDSSGDYEQLNLNREEGVPQLSLGHHQHVVVDDDTGEGTYGVMIDEEDGLEDDINPGDDQLNNEFYDHLDRGPVGNVGHRPLG